MLFLMPNQQCPSTWMNYCNTVLTGAPRRVMDKLQRVLNAAAHVITNTRKFDHGLGQILHDQLHWLDVPNWVLFKLAVTVHQCLNGRTPLCLSEHCIPVSNADTRRHLHSTKFTSVWTAAHHCICRSTASRSPMLTRGGICIPPTVTYLPFRVSDSTLTVVGSSLLLARWPGTHFQILSRIQRAAQTVLGIHTKRTSSQVTSA